MIKDFSIKMTDGWVKITPKSNEKILWDDVKSHLSIANYGKLEWAYSTDGNNMIWKGHKGGIKGEVVCVVNVEE